MSAALYGVSFGRIKIGRKSLEGTLAMFSVCFAIGLLFNNNDNNNNKQQPQQQQQLQKQQ